MNITTLNSSGGRTIRPIRRFRPRRLVMSYSQWKAWRNVRRAAFIVGLCVTVAASSPAFADKFSSLGSGWQRYSNDLYGTQFEFPAKVFSVAPAPSSGDGRQFTSDDATLEIYATPNTQRETASSLRRRLLQEESGYDDVTYAPAGRNWLVLSGFRGDTIFYEKYLLKGGIIHAFGIEFPASAKPFYAPIVERIEDSFRARAASHAVVKNETAEQPAPSPERSTKERDPLVIY
jgi:hypothetical protein